MTFSNCESLKNLVLPDSITEIHELAFHSCKSLENVVIPEKTVSIGNYAFAGCLSLNSMVIPQSVRKIGKNAFAACPQLSIINLSNDTRLTGFNVGTFSVCNSLTNIVLPRQISYLCSADCMRLTKWPYGQPKASFQCCSDCKDSCGVFQGCENLRSVTLNASMIGYRAFANCKNLVTVNLTVSPGSYNDLGCCYSICTSAFENCTSLTQIVIPYGFTFIGDKAFAGCTNLKNVYLPNTVQFIGRDAFQNTPFNVVFMESQKQYRKNANLCQYCGGTFKGLLTKTCSRCGKIKDY